MCTIMTAVEAEFPEFSHIQDRDIQAEVKKLVTEYQPKKIKESPVELKKIVSDDVPVYQRARRFPPKEKEAIEKQIKL